TLVPIAYRFPARASTPTHPLSLHDALPIWPREQSVSLLSRRHTGTLLRSDDGKHALPPQPSRRRHRAHRNLWAYRQRKERRALRSEEHTSELQSRVDLVCRLLLEKKKRKTQ